MVRGLIIFTNCVHWKTDIRVSVSSICDNTLTLLFMANLLVSGCPTYDKLINQTKYMK